MMVETKSRRELSRASVAADSRALHQQRADLHSALNDTLPISLLPNEILAHILLEVAYAMGHTVDLPPKCWAPILFVCRRWRACALAIPALWAHIAIQAPEWFADFTRTDLARAGNHPLTCAIVRLDMSGLVPTRAFLRDHGPRVRTLRLSGTSAAVEGLFAGAQGSDLPILEHLLLHLGDTLLCSFPEQLLRAGAAPRLSTVDLHGVQIRSWGLFANLTELHVVTPNTSLKPGVSLAELLGSLAQSSGLRTLTLSDVLSQDDDTLASLLQHRPPFPTVELPALEDLNISESCPGIGALLCALAIPPTVILFLHPLSVRTGSEVKHFTHPLRRVVRQEGRSPMRALRAWEYNSNDTALTLRNTYGPSEHRSEQHGQVSVVIDHRVLRQRAVRTAVSRVLGALPFEGVVDVDCTGIPGARFSRATWRAIFSRLPRAACLYSCADNSMLNMVGGLVDVLVSGPQASKSTVKQRNRVLQHAGIASPCLPLLHVVCSNSYSFHHFEERLAALLTLYRDTDAPHEGKPKGKVWGELELEPVEGMPVDRPYDMTLLGSLVEIWKIGATDDPSSSGRRTNRPMELLAAILAKAAGVTARLWRCQGRRRKGRAHKPSDREQARTSVGAQIRTLHQQLADLNSALNDTLPISLLPNELLVRILLEVAYTTRSTIHTHYTTRPWTPILYVCRRWTSCALALPALWAHITVLSPDWLTSPRARTHLTRAGNYPLTCYMGLVNASNVAHARAFLSDYGRRVRTICLGGTSKAVEGSFAGTQDLPIMEHLCLGNDLYVQPCMFPEQLLHAGVAPRLSTVHLQGVWIRSWGLFANLTELHVITPNTSLDSGVSLAELLGSIAQSPGLRALTLNSVFAQDADALATLLQYRPRSPTIELPALEDLDISESCPGIGALLRALAIPPTVTLFLCPLYVPTGGELKHFTHPLRRVVRQEGRSPLRALSATWNNGLYSTVLTLRNKDGAHEHQSKQPGQVSVVIDYLGLRQRVVRTVVSRVLDALPLEGVVDVDCAGMPRTLCSRATWRAIFSRLPRAARLHGGADEAMLNMVGGLLDVLRSGPQASKFTLKRRNRVLQESSPSSVCLSVICSREAEDYADPYRISARLEELLALYRDTHAPHAAKHAGQMWDELELVGTGVPFRTPLLGPLAKRLLIGATVWTPASTPSYEGQTVMGLAEGEEIGMLATDASAAAPNTATVPELPMQEAGS
ncbi:hypothetical protein FA95DRAFT_345182 [Auriscalpium vulgare]|uniref:Uncharacterized protein n=1 Tax=Auriscalpium vulgare TaxID=40419 RepID=A0ACB8RIY4_9AGAM|nr:hypothetical protein FA95DRAFT_345182 [Auriscalpium vulgare]